VAAIAARLRAPGITAMAGAMARTGAASLGSALLSMAANKVFAAIAGPPGIALLTTLQQTRQAAVTAATLNGQTALVQGISARRGQARVNYVRTTLTLWTGATALVTLILLLLPESVAELAGLGARGGIVRFLAPAVGFTSAFVFLGAVLNARGQIGKLAALQLASPAMLAALAYPAARALQLGFARQLVASIAIAAAASALAACAAAGLQFSHLRGWIAKPTLWWDSHAAEGFLCMSASMLGTGLLGSASLLLVRKHILESDGPVVTGSFDAAWAFSMNQVTLVLASLQTYLLPALARSPVSPRGSRQISHALLLATAITAPAIILITGIRPWLLLTLYSPQFAHATLFLRWTLIGDYLKVASWIFSMPILAAGDMKVFVAADVTAYGMFTGGAALLARWWPQAEAAAMAFVLMYAAHLAICLVRARKYAALPDGPVGLVWFAGFLCVCGASAIFWQSR
jgi:O-antigen/teichoic acid export membrane protein